MKILGSYAQEGEEMKKTQILTYKEENR